MITILFISHSSRLYGAERSLVTLAEHAPDCIKPVVATPGRGALTRELERKNIAWTSIPHICWIGTRLLPVRAVARMSMAPYVNWRMRREIRRLNPSVIYSNSLATDLGLRAARATGIPHLQHCREYIGRGQTARFTAPDRQAFLRLRNTTRAFICNAEPIRDYYQKQMPDAVVHVVHNGIAPPCIPPARDCARDARQRPLLVCGSINRHKNQEEALRILARLRTRGCAMRLRIVGDGSSAYRKRLLSYARERGLESMVDFVGFTSQMDREYQTAAVCISPSLEESFGRVIVEAMMAGTPVVARRSSFTSALIRPCETGMIYEPGDIDGAAEAIEKLCADSAFREKITRAAREQSRARFSVESYVQGVYAVIRHTADRESGDE